MQDPGEPEAILAPEQPPVVSTASEAQAESPGTAQAAASPEARLASSDPGLEAATSSDAEHEAATSDAGLEAASSDAELEAASSDAEHEAATSDAGLEAASSDAEPEASAAPASAAATSTDPKVRNLAELESLCADLERVVTIADVKLKTLEKRLASADSKYPKLLPLPGQAKKAVTDRFQEARRKLVIRLGELNEAEEWKRWANVPKLDALIVRVEAMAAGEIHPKLALELKAAQDEWKELGQAPQAKGQDLWVRFKAATDAVYDKVKAQRAVQDAEFEGNLKVKQELCERAEALSASSDWAGTAEALKKLQAEWKLAGPVPRKKADAIWKRFRTACDAFFERRRPHLERSLGEKLQNLERKQAIVERIEALLAGEGDWDAAVTAVEDARREWQYIGNAWFKELADLTERVNKASDEIFARRDEARKLRAAEARAAVEGPLAEIEALLDAEGADLAQVGDKTLAARAALREFDGKNPGAAAPLRGRLEAVTRRAIAAQPDAFKGSDLDPEQSRKRKEKLLAKIEELAPAPAAPAQSGPLTPADMAAKLKAALADRALGGILSKQAKGRASRDVVTEAKDSWAKLGPVPGPDGEALEQRFADACRRVTSG